MSHQCNDFSEAENVVSRTYSQLIKDGVFTNLPFISEHHFVGSNKASLIRIDNNPAGHYPDPPCSEYTLQITTRGAFYEKLDLGAGAFQTNVRKGLFCVTPPDETIDFQLDSMFCVNIVTFSPEFFEDVRLEYGNRGTINLELLHKSMHENHFVEQLVSRMMLEAEQGCPNGPLFADHSLGLLAVELLHIARQADFPRRKTKPVSDRELAKIDAILQDQLGEKITLEDIARELGYTKFHLSKAFSTATGTTLHQHLMQRRLQKALGMLSKTSESIAFIAYECGFSSQSHMNTVFQKHVGITPGAYRKQKLS